MTTILVTQHYAPDETSTADYLTTIAEEIAQDDDVIVLSGTRGSASAGGDRRPRVIELATWTPPKGALLQRGLAMLLFAVTVFGSLLRRSNRSTTVIAVTTPFLLPWVATLAAWIKRARRVLIVYDLYPDALIAAGMVKERSFPVRLIRRINEWMYRTLDAIVIIGRDMEKHFAGYRAPTAGKLVYIPNWATLPAGLRPIDPDNRFRRQFDRRFVVGLSGNLGFTHDPETVFAAARELAGEAEIGFLLSGWGVGWTRLKSLQDEARLPNVQLIERVSAEDLDAFLACADCWLIPYRKGMAGISVPSRLYNLLATGRPIIVLSESDAEHAQMLTEHDVGWVVAPTDPSALAQVIRAAAADPTAVTAKAHRAVDVIGERFTRAAGSRAYRALVERLRTSGTPATSP
jgi:glycosyltransferase involved in cell wall biosynthesis